MTPIINKVRWSASNLPYGISFDEATGTFSGTPEEAGEYVVPVSVETNYGSYKKDIEFVVTSRNAYSLYAIGKKAKQWSEDAEPDTDGFRKLNISECIRLNSMYGGFCAQTKSKDWYVVCEGAKFFCGYYPTGTLSTISISSAYPDFNPTNKPTKFPIDGVNDMCQGATIYGGTKVQRYVAYRVFDTVFVRERTSNGSNINFSNFRYSNVTKLTDDFCTGILGFSEDSLIVLKRYSIVKPEGMNIKKAVPVIAQTTSSPSYIYILTNAKKLYRKNTTDDPEQIYTEYGEIENFWALNHQTALVNSLGLNSIIFIQTTDGRLFALGENRNHEAGLMESKFYDECSLVGMYKAKKITHAGNNTFILSEDGKLYHTGAGVSGITVQHDTFTPIFEGRVFSDVIYTDEETLMVGIEE